MKKPDESVYVDEFPTLCVKVVDGDSGKVYYEHIDTNDDPTSYVKDFLSVMFDAYYHMGFLNKITVKIDGGLVESDKIEFDPVLYAQMLSNDLT